MGHDRRRRRIRHLRRRERHQLLAASAATAAALVAAGNLLILAGHMLLRGRRSPAAGRAGEPIEVCRHLRRGVPPRPPEAAGLARAGIGLIIDLRAEAGSAPIAIGGVRREWLPIRDGRPPSPDLVARFRSLVSDFPASILVHCSAGVGRTGSVVASHRVLDHGWEPRRALTEMLSVGPPSLEQIAFVLRLGGGARPVPLPVVAVSDLLDGPRRIWSRLREGAPALRPIR